MKRTAFSPLNLFVTASESDGLRVTILTSFYLASADARVLCQADFPACIFACLFGASAVTVAEDITLVRDTCLSSQRNC